MEFETNGRTDRQTPGIEFGASVTSGENNFNEFPGNWPNFVYLLVDPGFYPLPLNFLNLIFNWSTAVYFPIGWTPVTDTTVKETNERTNGRTDGRRDATRLFVRLSVRLLDGVWHYIHVSMNSHNTFRSYPTQFFNQLSVQHGSVVSCSVELCHRTHIYAPKKNRTAIRRTRIIQLYVQFLPILT